MAGGCLSRYHNTQARTASEPESVRTTSETGGLNSTTASAKDALALLLSFLSPDHNLTQDFLRHGGSRRERWTVHGNTEEVDANIAGLSPDLSRLLSDDDSLGHALDMLSRSILNKSGQAYMLDKEAASGIRRNLSAEETVFWKCQAFITEYRAIPWKYIESSNINVSTILPHLRYTVSSYKDCFERLGSMLEGSTSGPSEAR
ncbi:hypothetical protein F5883DRAFT_622867 [Diaporthe sp. PMI_573]|nr:hypothetical protein F5883DRAFT_622867 [Diaporthaceae sp. PMI_573]